MVAQEVVQLRKTIRQIRIADAIDHVDALTGMGMEHVQPVDRLSARIDIIRLGHDTASKRECSDRCRENDPGD